MRRASYRSRRIRDETASYARLSALRPCLAAGDSAYRWRSISSWFQGLIGMAQIIIPAITLWQPWACAIEIGVKTEETRSKPIPNRLLGKRVAIHAAKRPQRASDMDEDTWEAFCDAFGGHHTIQMLPLGVIVCSAILAESIPTEKPSLILLAIICQGDGLGVLTMFTRLDHIFQPKECNCGDGLGPFPKELRSYDPRFQQRSRQSTMA